MGCGKTAAQSKHINIRLKIKTLEKIFIFNLMLICLPDSVDYYE